MIELTPQNVEQIFMECLLTADEKKDQAILSEGILLKAFFKPERLKYYESEIQHFLDQLPDEFEEGWSFLNMCFDKNGDVWTGEHRIVEMAVLLGTASGMLSYLIPREQWSLLPGGMPYLIKKIT